MSDFSDTLNNFTLNWEGRTFENIPGDLGGATNHGITQTTYDSYNKAHSLPLHSVIDLADKEMEEIYLKYWTDSGCDMMNWPLNAVIFDCAVNGGVSKSIKILQFVIGGLTVDGVFGPKTFNAVSKLDYRNMAHKCIDERENWYTEICQYDPTQNKFLNGWIKRCESLRKYIGGNHV